MAGLKSRPYVTTAGLKSRHYVPMARGQYVVAGLPPSPKLRRTAVALAEAGQSRRTGWLVLSCVILATAAAAQTAPNQVPQNPTAPEPRNAGTQELRNAGSISGRVIDAETRRPIADATVTLLATGRSPADRVHAARKRPDPKNAPNRPFDDLVTTVEDGRYAFEGLPPGRYVIVTSKHGYADQTLGAPVETAAAPRHTELTRGQRVADADMVLTRGGSVTGRVTDIDGQGVSEARVQVIAVRDGGRFVTRFGWQLTDAHGDYRIENVAPGEYLVSITPTPTGPFARGAVFFPGTASAQDATPVTVRSGEVASGINLALIPRQEPRVSFQVLRQITGPDDRIEAFVVSGSSIATLSARKDGLFTSSPLEDGRYVVWVRSRSDAGVEAAWQTVDIGQVPIDLQLAMMPTGRIEGRIVTETGEPLPLEGLRVAAVLHDGDKAVDPTTRDQAESGRDGRFEIDGLFGTRRLRVIGLPSGWALSRVLSGRSPIHEIDGSAQHSDLLVVIARR